MGENSSKQKIIGIKQFRHLVESFIVETETKEKAPQLENFAQDIDIQERIKQPSFIVSISQFLRRISNGTNIVAFFINLYKYLSHRIRVFFVLISVIFEIINNIFDGFKKLIIRNLFWGRGSIFRFSFQFVIIVLAMIMLLSSNYREIWAQKGVGVSGRPVILADVLDNTQQDVIVQNATTKTIQPKNRVRQDIDSYVVKEGESLSSIAKFYNINVETLMWANNISSASLISPGKKLIVPPDNGVLATIESGDTLDSLASKFSSNKGAIAEFNLIDEPYNLVVGEKIFIPNGRPYVPPTPVFTFSGIVTSKAPWWKSGTPIESNPGPFLSWPVTSGRGILTQSPNYWNHHLAIDVADSSMPDVVAAANGTVFFAGCHSGSCPAEGQMYGGQGYARAVVIDHGNGYATLYAHLNQIYVVAGQAVVKGQALGQMGASGQVTGIHVHFEVWKGVEYNNPNPDEYRSIVDYGL